MIRSLLALAVLLFATEARAAAGLAWQWPDAGWRHHLVARVLVPEPRLLMGEFNNQTRVNEVQMDAIVHCVPMFRGKASTEVSCTFEDLSLQVNPLLQDENTPWPAVVEELDQRWTKATVKMTLGNDGRLKRFDVEGVDQGDPRLRENFQTMRLFFNRLFAAFDLGLPPKGDDHGKGLWTQSGTAVTELMSLTGSFGQMRVMHQITGTTGAAVAITSSGKGIITSDPSANAVNYYETVFKAASTFDTARGVMVERQYLSRGEVTASSYLAQGSPSLVYLQMARLTLLEDGVATPALPPSGRLPKD